MEKSELSYIAGGNMKWYSYFGKWSISPQKIKHRIAIGPSNSTYRYLSRPEKHMSPKNLYMSVHRRIIHKIKKVKTI